MAANGPLPSHLTFLNSLASHPADTKVRFIGCVVAYDVQRGVLDLVHEYQTSSSSNVLAMVDITVIVETMHRQNLEIGAWINVIGYVREFKEKEKGHVKVGVQAIMIWSAEGVRLGNYEKAVAGRLAVEGKNRT